MDAGAWTSVTGRAGRSGLGPRWLALAVMAQMVMGARHNVLGFRREIVNGSALGEGCVQRIELRSSFHKDARKVALRCLDGMCRRGLGPDVVADSTVISAC